MGRPRLTYANVTSTLALVLALAGGSAYAANHYLITSPKQIKPSVLRALHGSTGATGPAGTNGAPGSNGANGGIGPRGATGTTGATGATGSPGTPGTNGTNYTPVYGAAAGNGQLQFASDAYTQVYRIGAGVYCVDRGSYQISPIILTLEYGDASGTQIRGLHDVTGDACDTHSHPFDWEVVTLDSNGVQTDAAFFFYLPGA